MPQTSPGHQFEHLPLVLREHGRTRVPRRQIPVDPTTEFNRANRVAHANGLTSHTSSVSTTWKASLQDRVRNGLPPTDAGIRLLLKIDTSLDLDDLRRQFEFEIVSEQEDGYVIVASEDVDLADFQTKLTDFAAATGSANIAKIHEIREDLAQDERLSRILSPVLMAEWPVMHDTAADCTGTQGTASGHSDSTAPRRRSGSVRDGQRHSGTAHLA